MSESHIEYRPADGVRIVEGVWMGKRGVIQRVNQDVGHMTMFFDHFGRIVPCELEFSSIEKLSQDEWDEELKRIHAYLFGT